MGGKAVDPDRSLPDLAEDPEAAEVLAFWLGHGPYDGAWARERQSLWFSTDADVDATIAQRFASVTGAAVAGRLGDWLGRRVDWLAWLIAVDQFPRNLHRGSGRAFDHDVLAQRAALRGCEAGLDRALPLGARLFCYLPFEHAEDRALQDRSVAAFEALLSDAKAGADPTLQQVAAGWLDYARKHAAPIRLFGRFPHRNDVLGRESSDEEAEWLRSHPDGF